MTPAIKRVGLVTFILVFLRLKLAWLLLKLARATDGNDRIMNLARRIIDAAERETARRL